MAGTKMYVLIGAAVGAGLLTICLQLGTALWAEGFLPLQHAKPAMDAAQRGAILYGWTPLCFLALILAMRPSIKGALLAAAIFFPLNVVIGYNVVAMVMLAFRGHP